MLAVVNMATLTDQKKVGKCIQDSGLLYVMLHRLCNGVCKISHAFLIEVHRRVNHAKKTIHHVAMANITVVSLIIFRNPGQV